jgi:hypothetical protein
VQNGVLVQSRGEGSDADLTTLPDHLVRRPLTPSPSPAHRLMSRGWDTVAFVALTVGVPVLCLFLALGFLAPLSRRRLVKLCRRTFCCAKRRGVAGALRFCGSPGICAAEVAR